MPPIGTDAAPIGTDKVSPGNGDHVVGDDLCRGPPFPPSPAVSSPSLAFDDLNHGGDAPYFAL